MWCVSLKFNVARTCLEKIILHGSQPYKYTTINSTFNKRFCVLGGPLGQILNTLKLKATIIHCIRKYKYVS